MEVCWSIRQIMDKIINCIFKMGNICVNNREITFPIRAYFYENESHVLNSSFSKKYKKKIIVLNSSDLRCVRSNLCKLC